MLVSRRAGARKFAGWFPVHCVWRCHNLSTAINAKLSHPLIQYSDVDIAQILYNHKHLLQLVSDLKTHIYLHTNCTCFPEVLVSEYSLANLIPWLSHKTVPLPHSSSDQKLLTLENVQMVFVLRSGHCCVRTLCWSVFSQWTLWQTIGESYTFTAQW